MKSTVNSGMFHSSRNTNVVLGQHRRDGEPPLPRRGVKDAFKELKRVVDGWASPATAAVEFLTGTNGFFAPENGGRRRLGGGEGHTSRTMNSSTPPASATAATTPTTASDHQFFGLARAQGHAANQSCVREMVEAATIQLDGVRRLVGTAR